jgi:hypothetical protein
MQPASKRSSRSNVVLSVGPMSITVSVYSGVYKAPSASTFCKGTEDGPHEATPIQSERFCAVCSAGGQHVVGEEVRAYKSDTGALVPLAASAQADRLLDVAPLRDVMQVHAVDLDDLRASAIESSNLYWLTPSAGDAVAYLGLVKAIEEDGLVLVTAWASRSVAKLYRINSHNGLLSMVELVPAGDLRAAPIEPPTADAKMVDRARALFALAAEPVTREEIAQLAIDPGREALRRAANEAERAGAEPLVKPRGERITFEENAATADLTALLEADLLS